MSNEIEFHFHGLVAVGKTIALASLQKHLNRGENSAWDQRGMAARIIEPSTVINNQLDSLDAGYFPESTRAESEHLTIEAAVEPLQKAKASSSSLYSIKIISHEGEKVEQRHAATLSAQPILKEFDGQPHRYLVLVLNPYLCDRQIAYDALLNLFLEVQNRNPLLNFQESLKVTTSILWRDTYELTPVPQPPATAQAPVNPPAPAPDQQASTPTAGQQSTSTPSGSDKKKQSRVLRNLLVEDALRKISQLANLRVTMKSGKLQCSTQANQPQVDAACQAIEPFANGQRVGSLEEGLPILFRKMADYAISQQERFFFVLRELAQQPDAIVLYTHLDLRRHVQVPTQEQLRVLSADIFGPSDYLESQLVDSGSIDVDLRSDIKQRLAQPFPSDLDKRNAYLAVTGVDTVTGRLMLRAMQHAILRRKRRQSIEALEQSLGRERDEWKSQAESAARARTETVHSADYLQSIAESTKFLRTYGTLAVAALAVASALMLVWLATRPVIAPPSATEIAAEQKKLADERRLQDGRNVGKLVEDLRGAITALDKNEKPTKADQEKIDLAAAALLADATAQNASSTHRDLAERWVARGLTEAAIAEPKSVADGALAPLKEDVDKALGHSYDRAFLQEDKHPKAWVKSLVAMNKTLSDVPVPNGNTAKANQKTAATNAYATYLAAVKAHAAEVDRFNEWCRALTALTPTPKQEPVSKSR
jgi:hypothetical protein